MSASVMGMVVTYNPDIALLERNLEALSEQTACVSVYDNGSANVQDIRALVGRVPRTSLIENGENLGLPVNYNRAMAEAVGKGYEWLLTMDQDSVLPEGYVDRASEYFDRQDVAVICPRIWNKSVCSREDFIKSSPEESASVVVSCVSSGSLLRAAAHAACGGFDERMFIDYVDFDYCKSVREHGYVVLRLNGCVLEHQIGESQVVRAMGKSKIVNNHSAKRKYYFFRNRMYYARKHGYKLREHMDFYRRFAVLLVLVLYEKEDVPRKFLMSLKGIFAGLTMKLPRG